MVLLVGVATISGCRGPSEDDRGLRLRIDPELLSHEWPEGPRREAVNAKIRKETRRFAKSVWGADPMPTAIPQTDESATQLGELLQELTSQRGQAPGAPAWTEGTPEPPRAADHDLPREWRVQVKQGETTRSLAKWAGVDVKTLLEDNRETLGRRKWLRTGDRLTVTMSENQKLAFDQAREKFARERIQAYFATRYVAQVVVYRVKRGETVSHAMKRYGKVPIWLLQEFNQMNFRRLKPGDEILIPVVRDYTRGQELPPGLKVTDEDSRPLTGHELTAIEGRLRKDLLARARLAIDDSNVFERDPSARPAAPAAGVAGGHYPGAGQPAPSRGSVAPSLAPKLATPEPVENVEEGEPTRRRAVIVKRGETLSHYRGWSGLTTTQIKNANPGLDPDRIFIGKKIYLPLTDTQYAAFVMARSGRSKVVADQQPTLAPVADAAGGALADKTQAAAPPTPARAPKLLPAAIRVDAQGNTVAEAIEPEPKPEAKPEPPKPKAHAVMKGETASAIAKRLGVSLGHLKRMNPGRDLDRLRIGQKLKY